ncbi:FecR family protein [Membranihabitans marinus]|uniref:FecR family protein n=1 Tax=Membranihabitans marinus TaxID=1227546 RepID=UPI001F1EF53F|nr:FecR family protein [Membranihabitans marinus]
MGKFEYIRLLFDKFLDHSINRQELYDLLNYIRQNKSESEVKEWMDTHWNQIKELDFELDYGDNSERRFIHLMNKIKLKEDQVILVRKRSQVINGFKNFAFAASFLVLISFLTFQVSNYLFNFSTVPNYDQAEFAINFEGKQFVHLPDGSTLIMNDGSTLSYKSSFGNLNREVQFTGEGFFDIAHDPSRPFIVHTGDVKTTVLGTAFNVSAYEGQSDVVVTVARGKVSVGDQNKEYEKIMPNEQLIVKKENGRFEKAEVDLDKALEWKNQFIIFDGMKISDAIVVLSKRFNVEIKIENEQIRQCEINANFMKGESLDQILRVFCGVLQAETISKDNIITIKGGRPCN